VIRNVFSCFLKQAREVAVVTLVGRLFHARAAMSGWVGCDWGVKAGWLIPLLFKRVGGR